MAVKKSELYSTLWKCCDELRGGMDASQYKDYVLVILFVKYISDKSRSDAAFDIEIPDGCYFENFVALKGNPNIGEEINKNFVSPAKNVIKYLNDEWDYVITVCGGANETCPMFVGNVRHRLHIGFDDPSDAMGTENFITNEFRRVRDEIKQQFAEFYKKYIYNIAN